VEKLILITWRRVIREINLTVFYSFNFSSIVKFPTRIGPNSFSTIDIVLYIIYI